MSSNTYRTSFFNDNASGNTISNTITNTLFMNDNHKLQSNKIHIKNSTINICNTNSKIEKENKMLNSNCINKTNSKSITKVSPIKLPYPLPYTYQYDDETTTNYKSKNRLNSNNAVKYLVKNGEWPDKDNIKSDYGSDYNYNYSNNSSKPSLNCTESRNKLIDFSKRKAFNLISDMNKMNNSSLGKLLTASTAQYSHSTSNRSESNKNNAEIKTSKISKKSNYSDFSDFQSELESQYVEESLYDGDGDCDELSQEYVEEDNNQNNQNDTNDKAKRLSELESKLVVPIVHKDNEKYKILKMREIKRDSIANNKSAKRAYDLDEMPSHQKNFANGIFIIYNDLLL